MNRRIATIAAVAVFSAGVAVAPSASAGNVAVSIGLPGFSVGYSNRGYGFIAAAPAPYYLAPYYAPAPVVGYGAPYVAAPVVYAPYVRPYAARPYYYYRAPVRVGYYGYVHRY